MLLNNRQMFAVGVKMNDIMLAEHGAIASTAMGLLVG